MTNPTTIPLITLNDGRQIPQVGLGTFGLPDEKVILRALEIGYRHIDTAQCYHTEGIVGRAVRESGLPREEVFVTTKLWNPDHGRAREALEGSLEKLGFDYVDLYLIHWPTVELNKRAEAWAAMEQARSEGLIRSIGVSNFTPPFLNEILEKGTIVPAANQMECHPTYRQEAVEAANTAAGVVTVAHTPLGRTDGVNNPVIQRVAAELGRTPAQVILRWHLQAGRVVIPKTSNLARLEENFAVTDFALSAEQVAAINALDGGSTVSTMNGEPRLADAKAFDEREGI
ncbi:hypothetical protein AXK12_05945 [Cephaloticoccus capnophilus]|uniref:NADP-dependent oxidoreductase domain-containing protein n=1 Tax=Cephaloticoccus capnophilus TaxID=1548208 RepID=A0A139SL08_9BACT|nr:aldo/keto reductase [Cephaloticoccus capnophilus]KXU35239.1 hypothetical protein AXK12_05945 [Cephaloticoccus capnophilus]